MAALVCRPPPAFIHFIPMLWAVLACVAILHTGGYYWNHLEPCGTPRILLDVHGCTGVQVPPLSYILFRTSWNLYDPRILLDVPCSLAIKHRKQIFQLGNRSHCAQWHPRSWTKKRFCAPSAPAQTWRHANSSSSFHMCFKPWGRWLMLCA